MIGLIVLLFAGGILGWLASIVLRTDAQQGILLNIAVGVAGALIGGLIVAGGSIITGITVTSLVVSFIGALVLLALVNLVNRGSVR